MKILHVAYIYPPNLNVADGITNVVYNVTKELARKGHQVTVYTSNILDLHRKYFLSLKHLKVNGVDVYYSRSIWRYKTFIITPSIFSLLSENINNFDVMHIHDCRSFQGISAYLFAKMNNIPYVFQPHGSYLSSLSNSSTHKIMRLTLDGLISDRIFRNASKVIALTQIEAQMYRNIGIPEAKIEIVPNGIDLLEYTDLPSKGSFKKRFNICNDKKVIIYLGRIHKIKGIDFLIKAYAYLIKNLKYKNTILVIAGPDDGYLHELQALIDNLMINDKVLFSGPLYGRDKLAAYVDSNIYVLPSRYETFPMGLIEAYACGMPVITSKLDGLKDLVINDVTGLLVEPRNTQEFAKSICSLLNDDDKADILGLGGKQFVRENFSIEKIIERLESLYEKIVQN